MPSSGSSPNIKVLLFDFYLVSSPLTMDRNSAHPFLNVSDDLRTVQRLKKRLSVPENPERFDHWCQVMSCQMFSSGTHYWELEVEGFWDIAVTYHGIARKAKEGTAFGCNKVQCDPNAYLCSEIAEYCRNFINIIINHQL